MSSVEMDLDLEALGLGADSVEQAAAALDEVMARAADALVGDYREHIDSGRNKSGTFPPLEPAYAHRKAREGFGGKPVMRRTDAFYSTITPRSTNDTASAVTTVPYAFMQSERRPHWISEEVAAQIEDEVGDHIEGAWVSTRGGLVSIG